MLQRPTVTKVRAIEPFLSSFVVHIALAGSKHNKCWSLSVLFGSQALFASKDLSHHSTNESVILTADAPLSVQECRHC